MNHRHAGGRAGRGVLRPIGDAWFAANSASGWATCPITESGFVRVSANRKVVPSPIGRARRPVGDGRDVELLTAL